MIPIVIDNWLTQSVSLSYDDGTGNGDTFIYVLPPGRNALFIHDPQNAPALSFATLSNYIAGGTTWPPPQTTISIFEFASGGQSAIITDVDPPPLIAAGSDLDDFMAGFGLALVLGGTAFIISMTKRVFRVVVHD